MIRFFKFVILALLIVFPVVLFYFISRKIIIRRIDCQSQYGACTGLLQEKLKEFEKKPIALSLKQIKEGLKKEAVVQDFSVQFKFPDRLEVNVVETKAIFALKSKNEDSYLYVDVSGTGLKVEKFSALAYAITDGELPYVGEKVKEQELFALNLLFDLNLLYQVTSGEMNSDSLTVDIPGSFRVIFPLEGDKNARLGALIVILDKIKSGDSKVDLASVREADLRFTNPVLR